MDNPRTRTTGTALLARAAHTAVPHQVPNINQEVNKVVSSSNTAVNMALPAMDLQRQANTASKDIKALISLHLQVNSRISSPRIVRHLLRGNMASKPTASHHMAKELLHSNMDNHRHMTSMANIAPNLDQTTHPLHRISTANSPLQVDLGSKGVLLPRDTVNRGSSIPLRPAEANMVKVHHQVVMDSNQASSILVVKDIQDKADMDHSHMAASSTANKVVDMVDSRVGRPSLDGKRDIGLIWANFDE